MPITQDRMLRLLQAGEQLLLNQQAMQAQAEAEFIAARRGEQSFEAAATIVMNAWATMPQRAASTVLGMERIRYNMTHSRNDYLRERKRSERGGLKGPSVRRVHHEPEMLVRDTQVMTQADIEALAKRLEDDEIAARQIDPLGTPARVAATVVNLSRKFSPEEEAQILAEGAEIMKQEIAKARYELTHGTPAQQASARAFLATQGEGEARTEDGTLDSLDLGDPV